MAESLRDIWGDVSRDTLITALIPAVFAAVAYSGIDVGDMVIISSGVALKSLTQDMFGKGRRSAAGCNL